ncbi:MAG: hypothetical protein JJT82_03000 [Legionellaceae bacterium]|nr:hypothetical protein [Legionellaceae bacterium]
MSLFLVACQSKYATNGESLYLKSRNGRMLEVPAPLSNSNISYFYQLALQTNPNPEVSIVPPTLSS